MTELLTHNDIAEMVGISRIAVRKKKNLEDYFLKEMCEGAGRPKKYYSPEVLRLWNVSIEDNIKKKDMKKSHAGKPQKLPAHIEKTLVQEAKAQYLSIAQKDGIAYASYLAVKSYWNEFPELQDMFGDMDKAVKYLYNKRIMRKDSYYTGYAHKEDWEKVWMRKWTKGALALKKVPTMRYDRFGIGMSAGLIGEGFGAGTFIWIDDHIGDSFTFKEQKGYKGQLPSGLYAIDGWSGMPLGYRAAEHPTSVDVALLIVELSLRYGVPLAIGLENSRIMKSRRLDEIITAMYPPNIEEMLANDDEYYWHRTLFPGNKTPVCRNIPHIPRYPFKAFLENFFQYHKKHDSKYFPNTYRDGGHNAVQNGISTVPSTPGKEDTLEAYFASLNMFLSEEAVNLPRTSLLDFAKSTGNPPTVKAAFTYFGGYTNPGTQVQLRSDQLANILYWLSDKNDTLFLESEYEANPLRRSVVKSGYGFVKCTFDGKPCQFVNPDIQEGRKHAIIPIPKSISKREYYKEVAKAAIFDVESKQPEFIGVLDNIMSENIYEVEYNRQIVRKTRAVQYARLDKQLEESFTRMNELKSDRALALRQPERSEPATFQESHAEELPPATIDKDLEYFLID